MEKVRKPIIIIASPRVGSNLLMHSLSEHPQAVCGGEWYCKDEISCHPDHWKNKLTQHCNLIKLCMDDPVPFDGLLVGLKREDIGAQLRSWQKACDTGTWMKYQIGEPSKYPSDAVEKIVRTNKRIAEECDLVFSYETLVDQWDYLIEQILKSANWAICKIEKATEKQT